MTKQYMVFKWFMVITLSVTGVLVLAQSTEVQIQSQKMAPDRADAICPILVGQSLPELSLRTAENAPFDLNAAVAEKPTVLIFFRGGWCPFCNQHLGELQAIESELIQLGYQIIAISPDRPGILNVPVEKNEIQYQVLSDSHMTAASALGIAFQLDADTVAKYKSSYGIDIEADSGQTHHLLPVPSVFIVGTDGVVQFSYVNPNYKVRLDSSLLLKAAEVIKKQSLQTTP